ncbi:MAG: Mth938-like domain-containing protein [Pseudomonadota bacterium]
MRMAELGYEGPPPIDSYGGGGFRVAGAFHSGHMIMFEQTPQAWEPGALEAAAFKSILDSAQDIDVMLVGMGGEIAPLPAATRAALESAGIGVEVMATAAACRTYNVLLAEARRVAVALIAV